MKTFKKADILIPKVNFEKWSVVACDQYTSEPEYWEQVLKLVSDAPSTLKITYPEVFLPLGDGEERIANINATMKEYIDEGIFEELPNSMIYVEREIAQGKIRKGVIGCIDLEEYDFSKGSGSLVRATEGTVLERIPPRVKIRENAPLELPHIMILIDDDKKQIIEAIGEKKDNFEKLYDFDLMMNGGHISGWKINGIDADALICGLQKLSDAFIENYGADVPELIYAVGDGNHSLATAKTCWENLKATLTDEEKENHPARYALCELVNLHDDALEFEPIHRVLFDVDKENFLKELNSFYEISTDECNAQCFECVFEDVRQKLYIKNPSSNLVVGSLQKFIDYYIEKFGGTVDYIHGDDVTVRLGTKKGNMGFILPAMEKNQLFKTVIKDGALPRKTFSMGEANEKRFYFEAKKIR